MNLCGCTSSSLLPFSIDITPLHSSTLHPLNRIIKKKSKPSLKSQSDQIQRKILFLKNNFQFHSIKKVQMILSKSKLFPKDSFNAFCISQWWNFCVLKVERIVRIFPSFFSFFRMYYARSESFSTQRNLYEKYFCSDEKFFNNSEKRERKEKNVQRFANSVDDKMQVPLMILR